MDNCNYYFYNETQCKNVCYRSHNYCVDHLILVLSDRLMLAKESLVSNVREDVSDSEDVSDNPQLTVNNLKQRMINLQNSYEKLITNERKKNARLLNQVHYHRKAITFLEKQLRGEETDELPDVQDVPEVPHVKKEYPIRHSPSLVDVRVPDLDSNLIKIC